MGVACPKANIGGHQPFAMRCRIRLYTGHCSAAVVPQRRGLRLRETLNGDALIGRYGSGHPLGHWS